MRVYPLRSRKLTALCQMAKQAESNAGMFLRLSLPAVADLERRHRGGGPVPDARGAEWISAVGRPCVKETRAREYQCGVDKPSGLASPAVVIARRCV